MLVLPGLSVGWAGHRVTVWPAAVVLSCCLVPVSSPGMSSFFWELLLSEKMQLVDMKLGYSDT